MSGTGKYTQYAPAASDKNTLLNKLYRSKDSVLSPPVQDLVGKEEDARLLLVSIANQYLTPSQQAGDPNYFSTGVNLDYADAPDLTLVSHGSANSPSGDSSGGPATPYFPDITSPGPGKTEGSDKADDPGITVSDIKPTYVAGGPKTGTRNPVLKARAIAAQVLGVNPEKLGDSGANK